MFVQDIRMVDLSDFDRGVFVDVRQAALSISESADLMGFFSGDNKKHRVCSISAGGNASVRKKNKQINASEKNVPWSFSTLQLSRFRAHRGRRFLFIAAGVVSQPQASTHCNAFLFSFCLEGFSTSHLL